MTPDNEEKLRQFNQEWDAKYSTDDSKPPLDIGGSGNSNLLESIQNAGNMTPATGPYVPPAIPTTGDVCSQCNTMHPPIRPGDVCPVAAAAGKQPESTAAPTPAPEPEKVVDAVVPEQKIVEPPPVTPKPPQQTVVNTETVSEPAPLAENNIPTEIHVNKYLAAWGDQIQAHCKANGIQNVKKLMRHITIEITDFLENYKGK